MPRIRKPFPSSASERLRRCLTILLSGASDECLAGELGCCGDSCCSSAVVSRALAEYCQHSDAAREAFTAAKGVEAMQVALTRGSPAVATAAARVLGALCSTPHGLRCVLQWQRDSGRDVLAQLAGAAGQPCLPPDLRAECVDALRSALGCLHGPAAGGGLELASLLQKQGQQPLHPLRIPREEGAEPDSGVAAGTRAPGGDVCGQMTSLAAVAGGGVDMLTAVVAPALLSPNMHLRAAAARLVQVAAAEGLLPSGPYGAARLLAAAIGLPPPPLPPPLRPSDSCGGASAATRYSVCADSLGLNAGGGADGGEGDDNAAGSADAEAAAAPGNRSRNGSGAGCSCEGPAGTPSPTGPLECCRGVRLLALCDLVAELAAGDEAGRELLVTLRGRDAVLELCGAALGAQAGGRKGRHTPSPPGGLRGGSEGLRGPQGFAPAEREALLDAVLVCLREGPGKAESVAFAVGAASLASRLLLLPPQAGAVSIAPRGGLAACADGGAAVALEGREAPGGTAAMLATALASWPQGVLQQPSVTAAVAVLLQRLCHLATSLLDQHPSQPQRRHPHGSSQPIDSNAPTEHGVRGAGLHPNLYSGEPCWEAGAQWSVQSCGTAAVAAAGPDASHVAAASALVAAAVRLYGALYVRRQAPSTSAASPSPGGCCEGRVGDDDIDRAGGSHSYPNEMAQQGMQVGLLVAQCLELLFSSMLRGRDYGSGTAVMLLAAPLAALADPATGGALAALTARTATSGVVRTASARCGSASRVVAGGHGPEPGDDLPNRPSDGGVAMLGSLSRSAALAAAAVVERLLSGGSSVTERSGRDGSGGGASSAAAAAGTDTQKAEATWGWGYDTDSERTTSSWGNGSSMERGSYGWAACPPVLRRKHGRGVAATAPLAAESLVFSLSADESGTLCSALAVWAQLMTFWGTCTCTQQQLDGGDASGTVQHQSPRKDMVVPAVVPGLQPDPPSAGMVVMQRRDSAASRACDPVECGAASGDVAAVAQVHGVCCTACSVRPMGPMRVAVESAEHLSALNPGSSVHGGKLGGGASATGGDGPDKVLGPSFGSGHAETSELAYRKGTRLDGQSARVLAALVDAIEAANKLVRCTPMDSPTMDASPPPSYPCCTLESGGPPLPECACAALERLQPRMLLLIGARHDRESAAAAGVMADQGSIGERDQAAGDLGAGGMLGSDLEGAEAILDDCLRCITPLAAS